MGTTLVSGKNSTWSETDGSAHGFASARSVGIVDISSTDHTEDFKAVYIGEDGSLKVTIGGTDATFSGIVAGTILPIKISKVFKTGSTAFSAGTVIGLNW